MLKKIALITVLTNMAFLVGCDKAAEETAVEEAVEIPPESQTIEDTEVDTNEPSETIVAEEQVDDSSASSIPEVPLSEYKDINQHSDLMWLTPLFIAQTERKMPDEEILNLMSAEYYNEMDGFKKQDIAKEQLPKVKANLNEYRGDYRVKLPVLTSNSEQLNQFNKKQKAKGHTFLGVPAPYPQRYDFSTQQFPLNECSFNVSNGQYGFYSDSVTNQQRIKIRTKTLPLVDECALEVIDETLARKIEEAITSGSNSINGKGEAYYRLVADFNNVIAIPIYAKVTYFNPITGEELITKEFHFQDEMSESF